MRHKDIVDYCMSKPGAWLDSPWGEGDNVAKVGDKIFCFFGWAPVTITVKNTREQVAEWRDRYPEHAGPAAYLNKQLWNDRTKRTSLARRHAIRVSYKRCRVQAAP